MAFNPCDLTWASLRGTCSRRIAGHKNQKNPHHNANANAGSQTSKALSEKIHANSITNPLPQEEENFPDSISQPDAKGEVQTQESVSDSHTDGISFTNRDSFPHSRRNTFALQPRSREKGRAQRYAFA
jgi:hypothetical protein